jgi:multidrug resistance efflux pump
MRRAIVSTGFALAAAVAAVAEDAPPTVSVKREEVSFNLVLNGAFDGKRTTEAAWKPQVWGEEVEVVEAHAPGPVQQGDVLLRLKSERIDDALRAGERDLAIAKAALATQQEDVARQQANSATALARAEFDAKNAQTALERFEKVEMPLRIEESEHYLQGLRNWETDQTEELAQLEKMYKGDDLTEETEDIVLKRARRDLERTKRTIDFQTRRSKLMREIDLPRDLESLRLDARRTSGDRDRAVAVTKLAQAQQKLELERTAANVEKQEREFGRLKADRELFELKAPVAGFAVPGAILRGKWQNADGVRNVLKKGGKFRPNDVIFTIVETEDGRIVTSVPEASLAWIRPGAKAQVHATQATASDWSAQVASVAAFSSSGEYLVELEPLERTTVPVGMTCKLRVETGKRTSILVPQTAIEDGGFEKWVYVMGADGKPARRAVTLGQTNENRVEVVAGLDEGDKVLVTPPKK